MVQPCFSNSPMPVRELRRTTCSSRPFQISYRAVSQSNAQILTGQFPEALRPQVVVGVDEAGIAPVMGPVDPVSARSGEV